MSWLTLVAVAVVLAAVAALTGIKPSGTKPVANTRLMTAARVVLFGLAALFLVLAVGNFAGA